MTEVQRNNPLHGIKLEALLTELVDHYGWEVLADAMKINCFRSSPSIDSSLKFLRRTAWARERLEGFYLYKYKRLPKPSDEQYDLPPRDRTIPLDQQPRSPAEVEVAKFAPSEQPKSGRKPDPYGKPSPYGQSKSHSKPNIYGREKSDDSVVSDREPETVSTQKPPVDVWAKWRK